ncbi:MAG: hypothetical protein LUD72_10170 [Bacteroidales bacterium]|nr:hypothetical protein [Bacteroidales bacterium]
MGKDYNTIISELFQRFPSFQKVGDRAYKPGIDSMLDFDALLGEPHTQYPTIHVAGTNGKGSVSTMLASALAAAGLRVGLYTSPHIFDFRERMRIIDGGKGDTVRFGRGLTHSDNVPFCGTNISYISETEVLDFVERWREEMDGLDLSFFEITTAMAFHWFSTQNIDIAVIEAGLGGRLDSTNIITPLLSIVTNIGFDHCEYLGHTLPEIAAEKAGIFKRGVPAIVGESSPETDQVFTAKSQEINGCSKPQIPEAVELPQEINGNTNQQCFCYNLPFLTFADKVEPSLWSRHNEILAAMDLQGCYQKNNLRTVLTALETLQELVTTTDKSHKTYNINTKIVENLRKFIIKDEKHLISAIEHSAARTDFHGRWEKLSERPYIIADIGHNSHGLKYNFAQLREMMAQGRFDKLYILYGAMADKDVEEIVKLFPSEAAYYFVTVNNHRAMAAEDIMSHYLAAGNDPFKARCTTLNDAVREIMAADPNSLVYIGGSAYLVSEALPLFE